MKGKGLHLAADQDRFQNVLFKAGRFPSKGGKPGLDQAPQGLMVPRKNVLDIRGLHPTGLALQKSDDGLDALELLQTDKTSL